MDDGKHAPDERPVLAARRLAVPRELHRVAGVNMMGVSISGSVSLPPFAALTSDSCRLLPGMPLVAGTTASPQNSCRNSRSLRRWLLSRRYRMRASAVLNNRDCSEGGCSLRPLDCRSNSLAAARKVWVSMSWARPQSLRTSSQAGKEN